jgi:fengycin family lipopeptide synthetase D
MIDDLCLDAVIEQRMPMSGATMYWMDALDGCNLDRPLTLPYDRYRLVGEHRSGRSACVSFGFGEDLSNEFVRFALSNDMSVIHVALGCYYVLLLKLTNGERDLCVGMNVDNRSRDEVKSVIGLFENTIPLRCQMDPKWCLSDLIEHVEEMMKDSETYSYYPVQRILAQHPNSRNPTFLHTSFQFQSHAYEKEKEKEKEHLDGIGLCTLQHLLEQSRSEMMSNFDFSLTIQHEMNVNQLSCTINGSLDLFKESTIIRISQQFHSILEQLFQIKANQIEKSLFEVSLLLPDETLLRQSINNTDIILPSVTCVHHEFAHQVCQHPQKIAVELDDQFLTYSELLYYVQLLALDLLNTYAMTPREIICQCVQRSISMVSQKSEYSFLFMIWLFIIDNRYHGD